MKRTRHKADTELVRQQNRSLVLETLRRNGTLASIELGEKTDLSPATISAITNDMISERLIETDKQETEKHRSVQRGRPKVKLTLTASAALVLGVRLTHNRISIILADFCGHILDRKLIPVETASLTAEAFSATMVESIIAFLDEKEIRGDSISIISVACQGSVDAEKGEIIWSPAFVARNIAIAKPLFDALNTPCVVANDTNMIAHFLHMNDTNLSDSFAILYLGSGIGLGLYVHGNLLEGSNGSASEFGHMLWKQDGALCRCGRRGCIEAYASDFGIMRAADATLSNNNPADISPGRNEMRSLAEKARAGDRNTIAAFEQAGAAIGTGLGNLIMLVNPRHILFAGPGMEHIDLIRPTLDDNLAHAQRDGNKPDIITLDDKCDFVEAGILAFAYTKLDGEIFAKRVSVEDVAARHGLTGA